MRVFVFVSLFLFAWPAGLFSQTTDSTYYLQLTDKKTQEALPFATLQAIEHGIFIGSWASDLDGMIRLKNTGLKISQSVVMKVSLPGYTVMQFDTRSLVLNDTIVITLAEYMQMFDEIEVIDYHIPMIYKGPETRREIRKAKKLPPPVDSTNIYTAEITATYDSIVNGSWFAAHPGTVNLTAPLFYAFLKQQLNYPEHAKKYNIEEKIYFALTFNGDGTMQKIELKKGVCPVLVIEAARVLSKIRLVDFPYGKTDNPVTYGLPVRFTLR